MDSSNGESAERRWAISFRRRHRISTSYTKNGMKETYSAYQKTKQNFPEDRKCFVIIKKKNSSVISQHQYSTKICNLKKKWEIHLRQYFFSTLVVKMQSWEMEFTRQTKKGQEMNISSVHRIMAFRLFLSNLLI